MFVKIWDWFKNVGYVKHLFWAFVLRLVIIQYGRYHDEVYVVPYTDVDYQVFTDAARHVVNFTSPYSRHTYRYTPLVAYLLVSNVLLHEICGKLIFATVDVIVALLIRLLVKHTFNEYELYIWKQKGGTLPIEPGSKRKRNCKVLEIAKKCDTVANIAMIAWIYNPITIGIATRGNCDSLSGLLVLATLYFLQCTPKPFLAGLLHGLAIHFRLYPIGYSLTYFMYLSKYSFYSNNYRVKTSNASKSTKENLKKLKLNEQDLSLAKRSKPSKKTIFKKEYLYYIIPNFNQIQLIFGCLLPLTVLTGLFYYLYGYQFLYETYIYHLVRKDTRHNFSLYFYIQYLTAGIKNIGVWQKVLIVLPQTVLLLVFSVRYGLNRLTLNFAVLSETIVMVTFNTVVTSQYFVWILAILPLCFWQINIGKKSALFLILIWFGAQATWLIPAYFLEFQGYNTFIFIWVQSVSFFCANIIILGRFVSNLMLETPEKLKLK